MPTPPCKTQFSNRHRKKWCYVSMNVSIAILGVPMHALHSCVKKVDISGLAKLIDEAD